jgi:hypothetical protein
MAPRKINTDRRAIHLVHGTGLASFKKTEDDFLEQDRKRGMTRSSKGGADRRPGPAQRRPAGDR